MGRSLFLFILRRTPVRSASGPIWVRRRVSLLDQVDQEDLLRGPAPSTEVNHTTSLRCVPLIFWDLCWLQVGFMLILLALCWLMLALCWLMLDQVGASWLMLAQVGPSWPQDASMLAPKSQKITGTHLPRPPRGQLSSIFDRKLLILEHPGS